MNDLLRTLRDIAVTANSQYLFTSQLKSDIQRDARDMIALDEWMAEEFGVQGFKEPPSELITEASLEFCEHEDELNDFLDNLITPECEELRSSIVGRYISFEMEAWN